MNEQAVRDFLFCHLGLGGKGWHAIETDEGIHWCGVGDRRRFMRIVAARGSEGGKLCAVPYQAFEDCRRHTDSGVVWARTATLKQAEALEDFTPRPSLILGEGIRRTALWAIREPLGPDWTLRANRRIAHHLGTLKRYAALSYSFSPTEVAEGDGEMHPVKFVVGRLPDAPDAESWKYRHAA